MSEGEASAALAEATSSEPMDSSTETKEGVEQKAPPKPLDFKGTKHKVKGDGGVETEIDYEELTRGYTHGRAANERFRLAAEKAKYAEEFAEDPEKFLRKIGKDPEGWAEQILLKKLKFENMTAEQKELAKVQEEAAELRKKAQEYDRLQETQQMTVVEQQAAQELDTEVAQALEASGLRGDQAKELLRWAAVNMLAQHHQGTKMPAKDAIADAQKTAELLSTEYIRRQPVDSLAKLLTKEQLAGIRKADVEAIRSQDPWKKPKADAAPTARPRPKALSTDDYFRQLEAKF